MAAKTCVYCLGEVSPDGPPRKAPRNKFQRQFRCGSCGKTQTKILEASDVYAGCSQSQDGKPTGKKLPAKTAKSKVSRRGIVKLSPALANTQPTQKSLADHGYQRKLAAAYAPHILPSTFQALKDGVEAGNATMTKMVLELYELVQTDKRVSIVNDNRSVTIDARGSGGGDREARRSFEATARMLDAAREKRLSQGNPLAIRTIDLEVHSTPEGISK